MCGGEGRGVPLCALWDCESRCVWGRGGGFHCVHCGTVKVGVCGGRGGVLHCVHCGTVKVGVCGGGFHCVHCTPQVEL